MSRTVVSVYVLFMLMMMWGCTDSAKKASEALRANAGQDIVVQSGDSFVLDAGKSSQVGVSFKWTQIDGPFLLFKGSLTEPKINLTAPNVIAKSIWTIELTVHDGKSTAKDQLQIVVTPRDETPPQIISRSPVDGAVDVSISTTIEIEFNEALNQTPALLADSITLTAHDGTKKAGTVQYLNGINSDNQPIYRLVFLLNSGDSLSYGEQYTVTTSTAIEGVYANKLPSEQWTFTTLQNDNALLMGLDLVGLGLNPEFQSSAFSYGAQAGFLVRSVKISAVSVDSAASISINNEPSKKGGIDATVSLVDGDNIVKIEVTSSNSAKKLTYTVNVKRQSLTEFAQQAYAKASNTENSDNFGISVAVSGDTLAVGAYYEDSNAVGVNCNNDLADISPANGIPDC